MKKITVMLVFVASVGFIWFSIKGGDVQVVRTEIEIAAPPAKVWSILVDIDKWQNWSPVINGSSGIAALGSKLSITMCGKEEGQDGPKYSPVITSLEPASKFGWQATMMAGFIFTNGKIIKLEKIDSGTRLIHTETFSGMMAAMMKGQMEKGVPPMLEKFNLALKTLAEK